MSMACVGLPGCWGTDRLIRRGISCLDASATLWRRGLDPAALTEIRGPAGQAPWRWGRMRAGRVHEGHESAVLQRDDACRVEGGSAMPSERPELHPRQDRDR